MNHRQRYLIVQNSRPRKPARMLIYYLIVLLWLLWCGGFVYYATEPDPFFDFSGRDGTVRGRP
jgi:hypothetical protein